MVNEYNRALRITKIEEEEKAEMSIFVQISIVMIAVFEYPWIWAIISMFLRYIISSSKVGYDTMISFCGNLFIYFIFREKKIKTKYRMNFVRVLFIVSFKNRSNALMLILLYCWLKIFILKEDISPVSSKKIDKYLTIILKFT